tara:strand:- start:421 stop:822 length:402 start_codon:yes stop_codon:yes gene_type:complete
MGLKELYDDWAFKPIMAGANKTPRDASEGLVAVNFLPNSYQVEVKNREIGDTSILLDTDPTKTKGSFRTDTAFGMYSKFLSSTATRDYYNNSLTKAGTKTVHLYNAQGVNANDKYSTSAGIAGSKGILYTTNM